MAHQVWKVTGGTDSGIIVREAKALTSPALATRLSCGALVQKLALEEQRLQFKRLTGSGPDTGFMSKIQLEAKKQFLPCFSRCIESYMFFVCTLRKRKQGWVSIQVKGKTLLVPTDEVADTQKVPQRFDPYTILGIQPDATDAVIKSAFRKV